MTQQCPFIRIRVIITITLLWNYLLQKTYMLLSSDWAVTEQCWAVFCLSTIILKCSFIICIMYCTLFLRFRNGLISEKMVFVLPFKNHLANCNFLYIWWFLCSMSTFLCNFIKFKPQIRKLLNKYPANDKTAPLEPLQLNAVSG